VTLLRFKVEWGYDMARLDKEIALGLKNAK